MARRSLWPREHGAYFQLAIPLIAAYLLRPASLAMAALTAAAWLAFLAHEPLLVALGHRGLRMRERAGRRAGIRLAVLAPAAAVLGALGLALAPSGALAVAALVAVPAAAVVALALRRAEHTLAGELVAAVALTGAAAPVLVAGGATPGTAVAVWLGWSLGFGATVVAVHRVIARHRRPASWIDRILAVALVAATAGSAALGWQALPLAIAASLTGLAAALVAVPPAATRLRAIGVAIAIAAAVSGAVAVLAAAG